MTNQNPQNDPILDLQVANLRDAHIRHREAAAKHDRLGQKWLEAIEQAWTIYLSGTDAELDAANDRESLADLERSEAKTEMIKARLARNEAEDAAVKFKTARKRSQPKKEE